MKKQTLINIFFVAGMALSWAGYYTISKWTVDYSGSVFFTGMVLRGAAFVALTIILLVKKEFLGLFKMGKVALILMLIGVFGFMFDTFANIGFKNSSVSVGTLLLKTDVLFANFISAIFLREKLHLSDWIGTIIMLSGVVFVMNINFYNIAFNWYDLFFILSALIVTINAFTIKYAREKHYATSLEVGYYNNFVVMMLFMISFFISGDINIIEGVSVTPLLIGLIALGGTCQSLIYIFYYRNLKYYPVWQVKLRLLLIPVISSIFGIFVFNEEMNLWKGIGMALVLTGAVVVIMREKINQIWLRLKRR